MVFFQGMDYLHRSPLKYHGRFKTSNVLIDSRWTVKITDWGLVRFRTTQINTENDNDYFGNYWIKLTFTTTVYLQT